jgi:hypothetical protein
MLYCFCGLHRSYHTGSGAEYAGDATGKYSATGSFAEYVGIADAIRRATDHLTGELSDAAYAAATTRLEGDLIGKHLRGRVVATVDDKVIIWEDFASFLTRD